MLDDERCVVGVVLCMMNRCCGCMFMSRSWVLVGDVGCDDVRLCDVGCMLGS